MMKLMGLLLLSSLTLSACDTPTQADPSTPADGNTSQSNMPQETNQATTPDTVNETAATTLSIDGQPYTLKSGTVRVTESFITINHGNPINAAEKAALADGEALLTLTFDAKDKFNLTQPDFEKGDLQQLQQFRIAYKQNGEVKDFSDNTIRTVSDDSNFAWTGNASNKKLMGTLESRPDSNDDIKVKYVYALDM